MLQHELHAPIQSFGARSRNGMTFELGWDDTGGAVMFNDKGTRAACMWLGCSLAFITLGHLVLFLPWVAGPDTAALGWIFVSVGIVLLPMVPWTYRRCTRFRFEPFQECVQITKTLYFKKTYREAPFSAVRIYTGKIQYHTGARGPVRTVLRHGAYITIDSTIIDPATNAVVDTSVVEMILCSSKKRDTVETYIASLPAELSHLVQPSSTVYMVRHLL